jgi:hypothetical protein
MNEPSLHSSNMLERKDAVRRLVERLRLRHGFSTIDLARATGHSLSRWRRMMEEGSDAVPGLSDLLILDEVFSGELLRELRSIRAPEREGHLLTKPILEAIRRGHSAVKACVGLSSADLREISEDLGCAHRDLNQLTAVVSAIEPAPVAAVKDSSGLFVVDGGMRKGS